MRSYLFLSSGGHLLLLAAWIASGALLSKPRMSYYAIDLLSSLPAGKGAGAMGGADVEAPRKPPDPIPLEERKIPASEVIRIKGKPKKIQAAPVPEKKRGLNLKAALAVLDGQRTGAPRGGGGSGGAGIVADAGPAFPYPWYLKTLADRLNDKWRPPRDFQSDTVCQVAFVIHRDGGVTDTLIEKPSGDSLFDQLAQRAVLYSNPLPPLPAGFPEETLRVHMKFVGKPL
ncbi:MAG: hypothetical protein A2992_03370 [Elusimicrobia bacterium RIFCSPLOWO2_01_FULL_59_12]|nr:MAG: hypothetical protein A2992_03370 [Elusimicrobia bacterium RIFCSPLOWO2_01_FULL_59_12]